MPPSGSTPTLLLAWHEAREGCVRSVRFGDRTISVTVPPGVQDGQTLVARGDDLPAAGLVVLLRVERQPESVTAFLTARQAGEGEDLRLATLSGMVSIRSPRGVADGQTILFDLASGPLLVTFRIGAPATPGTSTGGGGATTGAVSYTPPPPKPRTYPGVRAGAAFGVLMVVGVVVGVPVYGKAQYAGRKVASLGNYQLAAKAVLMYAQDNDDHMPSGASAAEFLGKIKAYARPATFATLNPNGGEMGVALPLAGKAVGSVERPSETRLLFDTKEWPSHDRAAAYVDGHARYLGSKSWAAGK